MKGKCIRKRVYGSEVIRIKTLAFKTFYNFNILIKLKIYKITFVLFPFSSLHSYCSSSFIASHVHLRDDLFWFLNEPLKQPLTKPLHFQSSKLIKSFPPHIQHSLKLYPNPLFLFITMTTKIFRINLIVLGYVFM